MTSIAPVSLYLDLERGKVADMEVVARAALAFSAAIKEAAFIIDPSLEIRVELASGTEGSLSLNSILRNLKNAKGETLTLAAIAFIVLSWFSNHALDYAFDKIADAVTGENHQEFTPEQRDELAAIVRQALADGVAKPKVQEVYRALERDPAIKGVGATQEPGARPAIIVPRTEFAERAGHAEPVDQTVSRRVVSEWVHVVLISPVLVEGNRRWKFRSSQGEFGASIKDAGFVESVLKGTTSIRMKAGIEMDIYLETTEEFRNGVWEIVDRSVSGVSNLKEPPAQLDLLSPEGDDDEPADGGG